MVAETFEEFERRLREFMPELDSLRDRAVMFGHGMCGSGFWFGSCSGSAASTAWA